MYTLERNGQILLVAIAVAFASTTACEDANGPGNHCGRVPVNASLVPVLYWGTTPAGGDYVPNAGARTSFVRRSVWIADDHLLVYSAGIFGGNPHQGIFEITIDPITLQYKTSRPYDLGVINSLDYDPITQTVLFANHDETGRHLIRAVLDIPGLVLQDTLLGPVKNVLAARFLGSADEVVYYAAPESDPDSSGFYLLDAGRDSFLGTLFVSIDDVRGFDVRAPRRDIVYGVTDLSQWPPTFDLHVLDIAAKVDSVTLSGQGMFRGVTSNPTVSNEVAAIISTFSASMESVLMFVDTDTGGHTNVSVRTNPSQCLAIDGADPAFSPGGDVVAFSSMERTANGGVFPWALWMFRR